MVISDDESVYLLSAQICTEKKTILSVDDILALIGDHCHGVIGQASRQPQLVLPSLE